MKQYRLPEDEDELHKILHAKPKDFEELLNDLKQKSKALKTLEKLLKDK